MRDAFFDELLTLFQQDERVVFLTGDLGYKLFDPLIKHDKSRVINFGIRESGMVGYAAGLAKTGLLPFVYSISPFITLRCMEQLKIDLCYNRAAVVVVGVGGGFAYGPNGPTHHAVDDVSVVSCLPGMTVWTPVDPHEVRACVRAAARLSGPAYLRLGRNREPAIHQAQKALPAIDEPVEIKGGNAGVIVTCGFILNEVMQAVEILKGEGLEPSVLRLATIRPFPETFLRNLLAAGGPLMTVEEQIGTGGLGQAVAVLVAEAGFGNPFKMLAVPDQFPTTCLSREGLLAWAGLDAAAIAKAYSNLAIARP